MSKELARQSLDKLEEARLAFLRARLGEAGLAAMLEMKDLLDDAIADIFNSADTEEVKRHYAMEKELDESGAISQLEIEEGEFIDKVRGLFAPINDHYRFYTANDQTFSVYRAIETPDPNHYGKILEIIGCVFNEDGSYSMRKQLQDSTRGRIPRVAPLPFEQSDADILDEALGQIDEIVLLLSAE